MKIYHIVLTTALCASGSACAETRMVNVGDSIKFCGTLSESLSWGPPNFGDEPKTDSKFKVWKLALDQKSVSVVNNSDKVLLEKIQIQFDVFDKEIDRERRSAGSEVCVTGTLWNGSSQGDVLPFILDADVLERK